MRFLAAIGVLLAVTWLPVSGQEQAPKPPEQAVENKTGKCLEPPPPLLRWQDYHGPYQKLIGTFARKLERKSAQSASTAHYKAGTVLCSLEVKDKFMLFVNDTVDPISFLEAGFEAGLDQASDRDPTFGLGAAGYGKRFAADFAGQTDWRFFTDFAYPTLFSEDPRYYPLGQGSTGARLFHATEHAVVAHRDDGTHMFNFSLWMGSATAIMLNDFIHPGNSRRFGPGAAAVGFSIGGNMGLDVVREFAPEIARKLHLPFRDAHNLQKTTVTESSPAD